MPETGDLPRLVNSRNLLGVFRLVTGVLSSSRSKYSGQLPNASPASIDSVNYTDDPLEQKETSRSDDLTVAGRAPSLRRYLLVEILTSKLISVAICPIKLLRFHILRHLRERD